MEVVLEPGLVEEGHIQYAAFVHGPDLDEVHPLADVGQRGRRGHHGLHAGALPCLQVGDAADGAAVLIAPGKPGDELAQGGDAQLFKAFGPGRAHAVDILYAGVQIRHGGPPLLWE